MMNVAADSFPLKRPVRQRRPGVRTLVADGQKFAVDIEQPDHLTTDVQHSRLPDTQVTDLANGLKRSH